MAKQLTIKQKVKKALNYLNAAYYNGAIGYPRVDNDFIKKSGMPADLFPHPSFKKSSLKYTKGLNKKKVKVTKEEAILFLSASRLITPSQIENVFAYIDYYLDDDLIARSEELQREINRILKLFQVFKEKYLNSIEDKEILKLKMDFYESGRQAGIQSLLASQDNIMFVTKGEESKAKCRYLLLDRKKRKELYKIKGIKKISTIREALDAFREEEMRVDFEIEQNQDKITQQQKKGV